MVGAATLAEFDPAWAADSAYGAMVDTVIKDAANWDRADTRFPFLRDFDIYAGHDWASGHGAFGAGNNQESSSEGMNFASGLVQWGQATGDKAVRDLGIYLYTTQASAIENYWFDTDDEAFPAAFGHSTVGMVWGDGGAYSTWFSAEPEMIQGINLLPSTGGHLYLGYDPAYVRRNLAELERNNGGPATVWQDIVWEFQALADAPTALAQFRAQAGSYTVEEGESRAHTFYWLKNLAGLGTVDRSVTANTPLHAVFVKDGVRTYQAANTGSTAITVRFSNGVTLSVPPRSVASSTGSTPGDTTAPSAPGGLRASGTTAASTTLAWSASTDDVGVAGYEVLRNGAVVGTTSGTSYTATGLSASTTYSFTVRAYDVAGNRSAGSGAVSVTTSSSADTTAPSVPSGLTASGTTSSSTTLAWSASTDNVGVAGYEVLRNGAVVGTTSGTSYTAMGLSASTTYSFTVRAYDAAGNRSAAGGAVSVTTPGTSTGRDATSRIEAESYDGMSGVSTEATADTGGGQDVGWIAHGDHLRFDGVRFGSTPLRTFSARVASGAADGVSGLVQVRLDSLTGPVVGSFAIASTGGWQTWRTVPANITGTTGTHTVYVTFESGQPADFVNVNWITFG